MKQPSNYVRNASFDSSLKILLHSVFASLIKQLDYEWLHANSELLRGFAS